jgi:molecular chaperone DnaK (HSP70)
LTWVAHTLCISVWQQSGVEIIASEQGNRTTLIYVPFNTESLIGNATKNQTALNSKNTIFMQRG